MDQEVLVVPKVISLVEEAGLHRSVTEAGELGAPEEQGHLLRHRPASWNPVFPEQPVRTCLHLIPPWLRSSRFSNSFPPHPWAGYNPPVEKGRRWGMLWGQTGSSKTRSCGWGPGSPHTLLPSPHPAKTDSTPRPIQEGLSPASSPPLFSSTSQITLVQDIRVPSGFLLFWLLLFCWSLQEWWRCLLSLTPLSRDEEAAKGSHGTSA